MEELSVILILQEIWIPALQSDWYIRKKVKFVFVPEQVS